MSKLYVNNNGKVLLNEGPTLEAGNRGHLYGDGVFETVRIFNGKPINLSNHYERMKQGAKALKIRIPSYFELDFFKRNIEELLAKSNIEKGGRCRISIDRISGGSYLPENSEATFFMEVYPIQNNLFELNTKGIEVDLSTEVKKFKSKFSAFKTKNGLPYVLAALEAQEKNLGDILLPNETGGILESSCANLFVVSNGVLYTPGLEEGCIGGTMRMQIINLCIENGIKVYECNILPQNLLAADEIFLTNAVKGIIWVSGYRTKRYFNDVSRNILGMLNDYWNHQTSSPQ